MILCKEFSQIGIGKKQWKNFWYSLYCRLRFLANGSGKRRMLRKTGPWYFRIFKTIALKTERFWKNFIKSTKREAENHPENRDQRVCVGQLFLKDKTDDIVDIREDDCAESCQSDGVRPIADQHQIHHDRHPDDTSSDGAAMWIAPIGVACAGNPKAAAQIAEIIFLFYF